ncbi:hypothetical protein [Nonomuraea sp. NPDC050691]
MSIDWERAPRVALETPWPAIALVVLGLPALAAALAPALLGRSRTPG